MKYEYLQFYIDGKWVDPIQLRKREVVNPATEAVAGVIALGHSRDVDAAVSAARRAFESYSLTTPAERRSLLERILGVYQRRCGEIATAIREEMGAPNSLAQGFQAGAGIAHLGEMIRVLERFEFEYRQGKSTLCLEPIGVCGLITPWNWPINQVAAKVVPALAAGCTMLLKPSEYSPFSAVLWAEVLHEAGVPPGVFNLVNGVGAEVGAAVASHPDVDMVSFTGSTRAGIEVARLAAPTVKRVHQELGGKSPTILLEDADFESAIQHGVMGCFINSGQSCSAPTRMLVPRSRIAMAEEIAARLGGSYVLGDPSAADTAIGPVVSDIQFARVEALIAQGLAEGAKLLMGGEGRPSNLHRGYYVRPTIFSQVGNGMRIARDEIFGPVLCILPYEDEEDAIRIANDTQYGLAAYVWSKDPKRALRVARRIRAGQVTINGTPPDMNTPFGGFKRSGNGREWGEWGLRDFLEIKAVVG
jgi:aldehyde dehydrogenase (NAD+)